MSEGSGTDYVLRLVAHDEDQPTETDAPDAYSGVAYDAGLQVELLEFGAEALQEFGMVVVRDCQREERYNAALWYALAHDLAWELKENCVVITDPKAE